MSNFWRCISLSDTALFVFTLATDCHKPFGLKTSLWLPPFKSGVYDAIGSSAFANCESLEKVTINQTAAKKFIINGSAFAHCYALKSINIPSKCTDIYGCAFLNCFSLEKITIPSATKIHDDEHECALGYWYAGKEWKDVVILKH